MSFEQSRRIFLTNLFGWLAAISSFPFIFIFSEKEAVLRSITILFVTMCLTFVWINKKGWYFTARHGLFICCALYLFITASSFGRAAGEQLIYLPVIFGAVLIFDFTEVKSLLFCIVFTLICLFTLEWTDYKVFSLDLSPGEQLTYYYGNLATTFILSVIIALFYFKIYADRNLHNEQLIRRSAEMESTINYFATSLYGKNTVDEILWDIAKNCIARMGFQDCVIYLLNEDTGFLEQKAAFGPKNPEGHKISNLIQLPVGKGIVGTVASTGKAEIIPDTTKDNRYIVDDLARGSEITVPIVYQNKVIGVIDSEHSDKNFFTEAHLNMLTIIASLASNKIITARAEEEKMRATLDRLETDKIKEVDKLKSQFYSRISHEFRTPLTLILGPLDRMISASTEPEETRQLKIMQSNGKKLLRLINDLMELSKISEGMLNLNLVQEDINEIIRKTIASIHSQAAQKNIEIETSLQPEIQVLSFDPAKIETILINLLSNAIRLTPNGGGISVRTHYTAGYLEIAVFNTGSEIPFDQLDTMFSRHYVADTNNLSSEQNIGLSLSKELAVMHGGNIQVANEEGGNCFTLLIPASSPESIYQATALPHISNESDTFEFDSSNKKPTVVIVEDSDQLREFLRRILQDDFELMEAPNGKEGWRICLECVPDLVVTDVMMPEMDGRELCRLLKTSEVTSHIPVIMLTALADLDSKLEGLELGADYYLAKPFEPKELIAVGQNMITQRKKLRDHFSKKVLLKSREWEGTNADERFLQKLVSLIESHLSESDFGIEELQKELGISRMQLHRKLKALTDKSATEFIRTIRLKIAAEMLAHGQDHVSQIAYQVGFSSLSYFTKCFKEQFGVTPSAYTPQKST